MYGPLVVLVRSVDRRKERKTHGVMGVRNRETLWLPEEFSRRWYKSLAKYHRSHRERAEQRLAVVQSLRAPPELAGEETLMIVRSLSITIKPFDKP